MEAIDRETWNSLKINDVVVSVNMRLLYRIDSLYWLNTVTSELQFKAYNYASNTYIGINWVQGYWAIWRRGPKPSRLDYIDD